MQRRVGEPGIFVPGSVDRSARRQRDVQGRSPLVPLGNRDVARGAGAVDVALAAGELMGELMIAGELSAGELSSGDSPGLDPSAPGVEDIALGPVAELNPNPIPNPLGLDRLLVDSGGLDNPVDNPVDEKLDDDIVAESELALGGELRLVDGDDPRLELPTIDANGWLEEARVEAPKLGTQGMSSGG